MTRLNTDKLSVRYYNLGYNYVKGLSFFSFRNVNLYYIKKYSENRRM